MSERVALLSFADTLLDEQVMKTAALVRAGDPNEPGEDALPDGVESIELGTVAALGDALHVLNSGFAVPRVVELADLDWVVRFVPDAVALQVGDWLRQRVGHRVMTWVRSDTP